MVQLYHSAANIVSNTDVPIDAFKKRTLLKLPLKLVSNVYTGDIVSLSLSLYTYTYIYTYTHIYIHTYTRVCVCVCVYIYIYLAGD
jgi:hypothetical protein